MILKQEMLLFTDTSPHICCRSNRDNFGSGDADLYISVVEIAAGHTGELRLPGHTGALELLGHIGELELPGHTGELELLGHIG